METVTSLLESKVEVQILSQPPLTLMADWCNGST